MAAANHLSKSRLLSMGAILTAVSFGVSPLNFVMATLLDYEFSSVVTALLLFSFPLLALLSLMLAGPLYQKIRIKSLICVLAALVVATIWFVNYAAEVEAFGPSLITQQTALTDFDLKRPYFFIIGFLICGFIGILAAREPREFIVVFLKAMFAQAAVLGFLYLLTYQADAEFVRLGGDAGLSIGILLSNGLSAGIALAFIFKKIYFRYLLVVPVIMAGIALSGTRAALVGLAASMLAMILLRPGRFVRQAGIFVLIAILVGAGFNYLGFIPEATLERLTRFQLMGSESRLALLQLSIQSFFEFPFGRTTRYDVIFPAGIEYAHNTITQIFLEAGILLIFPLMVLVGLCFAGISEKLRSIHYCGFLLFAVNVFTNSVSSGDAYASSVWFSLFFLAAMGDSRRRGNLAPDACWEPDSTRTSSVKMVAG